MLEQKLVSPLLDGFQMGDPISSHDGVRCCPAIKENSDNKYIVKILSIPASQSQLDALLLAGAFQDAAGALDYFKDLADGVVQEVKLHQQLARLDGFVPCDAWQVVPMDDNQLGYEIYLLTPYHRTLDRHLKKTALTHLEAVNMGLDLCAALAASRRAGYLYVDLKPTNIFIASDREFLIGDLGFMRMDSLKYAALPVKYLSSYTAPEMTDALSTISETADIYALGLILYQVYNDGQLPTMEEGTPVAAPANADYEMAEIILKACAAEPAERWKDPMEMGQALVAYMQRNSVNDVPIMPPDLTSAEPDEPEEEASAAEETEAAETPAKEEIPAEKEIPAEETEAPVESEAEEQTEEAAAEETESVETEAVEEIPVEEPAAEEAPTEEETQEDIADAISETVEEVLEETEEEESTVAEELAFIENLESDETEPGVEPEEGEISDEISAILAQVDELAALEIPDPVVINVPQLPEEEPEVTESEPEATPEAEDAAEEEDDDGEDEVDIPIAIPDLEPVKKKGKKFLVTALILALLAAAAYGGNYYYQNYYLVPVESITMEGSSNELTATISINFDETKLTAVCTDIYGNTFPAPVENGKAVFTGLNPGTQYTVTLKTDSFNKLVGSNSASFTTEQQIKVVSFTGTTGAEDGAVILSFTVDGFDPQNWTVEYAAEGKDAQSLDFTGHMVTVPGLTVGTPYTFQLRPTEESDVEMVGETTLTFTPGNVILAQDVGVASFEEDVLTLSWSAPEGVTVAGWTVRCVGEGIDETVTVTEATAQFSGIETGKTYTIDILADGMTQSSRTEIAATPLTISTPEAAMVNDYTLRVTWEYEGDAPAAGWAVSYTIDGGSVVETLTSDTNAADLSLVIPGASYDITVQGVDTTAVSTVTFKTPAAEKYTGLSYSLCKTPSKSGWNYKDIDTYTANFTAKDSISMVVYQKNTIEMSSDKVQVLYVVRDASGKVVSELCAVQSHSWKSLWKERYFYPTLPTTPSEPGTYGLEVYFNGGLALKKTINITE